FPYTHTPPTHLSTLSLHDALPISPWWKIRIEYAITATFGLPSCTKRFEICATPSLRAALKYSCCPKRWPAIAGSPGIRTTRRPRSEEHTSELQSRGHLVCRLLLEK